MDTPTFRSWEDVISNFGGLPHGYSVDDFITGKRSSYLRNKLIAKVMKDAGIIEEYSSGLKRVSQLFQKNGNQFPNFFVDLYNFTIECLSSSRKTEKVGEKVGEKLTVNQDKIIKFISENAYMSAKELSVLVGISSRKIEENIAKLKMKNLLKRIGSAKGGHWEVQLR